MQPVIDHDRWPERTIPEAVHRLEADGTVPGRPMKVDAEAALRMGLHRGGSDGLTSLGPAQMHDVTAASGIVVLASRSVFVTEPSRPMTK